ncbi:MAG: DUF1246 domain-containing protein, partial [Methanomassiliicoccales archaeon]
MASINKIHEIVDDYDTEKITIATLCSHSSLQIFYGAKREGFRTLGLAVNQNTRFYDAFPLAKPDEFLRFGSYDEILEKVNELINRNVILVPHGSFVEYMGTEKFEKLPVPTFGNRAVLSWESDREKQREWLISAGIEMPRKINDAKEID